MDVARRGNRNQANRHHRVTQTTQTTTATTRYIQYLRIHGMYCTVLSNVDYLEYTGVQRLFVTESKSGVTSSLVTKRFEPASLTVAAEDERSVWQSAYGEGRKTLNFQFV